MSDEVQTLKLPDYTIDYEPTKIVINNYDHLAEIVQAYANRYKNVVVTSDTEKGAKDIRAMLRKLSTALDDRRKEIKAEYNRPLEDFTNKIRKLQDSLDQSISPIDQALKQLSEQQRQEKQTKVQALIDEMAPNYGVSAQSIEIDPKWLNKTISKKAVVDGIAASMIRIKKETDELATRVTLLTKYAEAKGVDAAGWVDQLKQGQDVDYLMKAIDNQIRLAAEHKKREEARLAEQRTHQEKQGTNIIDTQTGEVVSHTVDLRITATIDQMVALKRYMDDLGVTYERVN